jgi:hypothetical protein
MKDFNEIESWTPKKLRTLRNQLNNRISTFKEKGDAAKELASSHALAGMDYEECFTLLEKVKKLLKG